MSCRIELAPNFVKEAKRLVRKYPSLKDELPALFSLLEQTPDKGILLGHGIYKIRLAIASKGRGKSGGLRIISWLSESSDLLVLLAIYDKGHKESVSDKEIKLLIKQYSED